MSETARLTFIRRLNLTRREYSVLLSKMERRRPKGEDDHELRMRKRHPYEVPEIPMAVEQPEGGRSYYLVFGRNISTNGISILHGGFIHPGAQVRLVLGTNDDEPLAVSGEVRHCRLFAGSCHEVGIQFQHEIDLEMLVGEHWQLEKDPEDEEDEVEVFDDDIGTILIAESFTSDLVLLQHHLTVFGLNLQLAETPGSVLDAVQLHDDIDMILYSLPLSSEEGMKTIEKARKRTNAPILVLTAESDPILIDRARRMGATSIIAKPYDIDHLVAMMRAYLNKSAATTGVPVYSTVADKPGMGRMIEQYIESARRIADQIERTYTEKEWSPLAEFCRQLKGSGCSYGFQNVTASAIAVLNGLEFDPEDENTALAVARLVDDCRLLSFDKRDDD